MKIPLVKVLTWLRLPNMKTLRFCLLLLSPLPLISCASGIEEPKYEPISKDGVFEVRQYPELPLVSSTMDGMDRRNESFRRLFKYISGENENAKKIAMTSPVLMESGPENESTDKPGKMSFLIPAEVAKEGSPEPKSEQVETRVIPAQRVAVMSFVGWRDENSRKQAAEKLGEWVKAQKLKPVGEPFFAFYDPPWIPEALRRNEVWQVVKGE
jgi:hypothetical protein